MKKQLLALALLLSISAAPTFAQTLPQQGPGKGQMHGPRKGKHTAQDRQKRADKMAQELGLSDKQKAKVEKIFQDQHQQMTALRSRAKDADRSKLKDEAQRIHASTDKELKKVLSKKQYAQLEAKRQQHQQQRGQDRKDGRPDGRSRS